MAINRKANLDWVRQLEGVLKFHPLYWTDALVVDSHLSFLSTPSWTDDLETRLENT